MIPVTRFRLVSLYFCLAVYAVGLWWLTRGTNAQYAHVFGLAWWMHWGARAFFEEGDRDADT